MSYFGFLLRFLMIPILILLGFALWDRRQGRKRGEELGQWPVWAAVGLLVLVALIYTTPWDNYLVATGVWWYDPALVTGLTLGWVPIEEYTFFVLQPILGGLWLAFLARRLELRDAPSPVGDGPSPVGNGPSPVGDGWSPAALRVWLPILLGVVWLGMMVILVSGWQPGTYLALELAWALPPIALQLGFGADILWRYRRLVFLSIAPMTLYLSAADALAIGWGTWTIDPAQSLNIFLGGILPVEEFLFFFLTNILLTFGIVLVWARDSHERIIHCGRRNRWRLLLQ